MSLEKVKPNLNQKLAFKFNLNNTSDEPTGKYAMRKQQQYEQLRNVTKPVYTQLKQHFKAVSNSSPLFGYPNVNFQAQSKYFNDKFKSKYK